MYIWNEINFLLHYEVIHPPHWFLISLFVYLIKAPPFPVKLVLNHHIGRYYLPVPVTESTKKTHIKTKCAWSNWFIPTPVKTKAPIRKTCSLRIFPGKCRQHIPTRTSISSEVWWLHLSREAEARKGDQHTQIVHCANLIKKKKK